MSDAGEQIRHHLSRLGWVDQMAIWLLSDPTWLLGCIALVTFPLLLISLWASRQMLEDVHSKDARRYGLAGCCQGVAMVSLWCIATVCGTMRSWSHVSCVLLLLSLLFAVCTWDDVHMCTLPCSSAAKDTYDGATVARRPPGARKRRVR